MQRVQSLICKILAYVEREQTNGPVPPPSLDGYTATQTHNHIKLCVEAGYLEADSPGIYPEGLRYSSIKRLTWFGHEALDQLRLENCGNNG